MNNKSKRQISLTLDDDEYEKDEGHEHDCDSHDELDDEEIVPVEPLSKKKNNTTTTTTTTGSKQTKLTDFFAPIKSTTTKKDEVKSPFFKNSKVDIKDEEDSDDDFESPYFSKSHFKPKPKKEIKEEEEDEEEEEEKEVIKAKPTKTTAKKSSKKKVDLTANKFSTLSLKDDKYVQEPQFNTSKREKMENIKLGAHMSIRGGYPTLIENAKAAGFNCLAFFTQTPRAWRHTTIKPEDARKFREQCKQYNIPSHCILPHGSYFINLCSPDPEKLKKSRDLIIHEMKNCMALGAGCFNFHPGSYINAYSEETLKESIRLIAESIDIALAATQGVTCVIECTAGTGSNVGHTFEQLRDIIALVKDKTRVGVCIDTCHLFAAGYNINSQSNCQVIFREFDRVVGFKYLRGIHLNDSKEVCGSRLDRHEEIGKGHIGEPAFKFLVNDKRFLNIPMILETPNGARYTEEVKLLYSFIKD